MRRRGSKSSHSLCRHRQIGCENGIFSLLRADLKKNEPLLVSVKEATKEAAPKKVSARLSAKARAKKEATKITKKTASRSRQPICFFQVSFFCSISLRDGYVTKCQ